MIIKEKKTLRAQYPKKLTLDNVRCILHISKRKASWLLANGYIKHNNNGKHLQSSHFADAFYCKSLYHVLDERLYIARFYNNF